MKEKGGGKLPQSFIRFKICERMGWDYWEYRKQPMWFIDQIMEFSDIEAEYNNREVEKS